VKIIYEKLKELNLPSTLMKAQAIIKFKRISTKLI
jgi:hypothetical protein